MFTTEAPTLNLFAPDFSPVGPEAMAAQARSWYASIGPGLVVLRYAQAREVLRSSRFAQSTTVYHAMQGVTEGPFVDWWQSSLVGSEDDRHARLTRLVSPAFRPARMEAMRAPSRRLIDGLLDRVAGRTEVDLVAELSDSYPMIVLSELLQVPQEVRLQVQEWSATLALGFGVHVAEHLAEVNEAITSLFDIIDDLIAYRRAHPEEGLLNDLIAARDAGDRLSDEELRSMVVGVLFGGHDTSRNELSSAMLLLAQHPDQWRLLARRPELAANAVEEAMRLAPAVPLVARTPKQDMKYEGLPLTVGTFTGVLVATANRDPAAFGGDASSFRIDVSRPPGVAFGGGVHTCLGYALARIEIQEALLALTERFEPAELTGPVQFRPSLGIFGPTTLPVALRPRRG
jgi:cytochrome P450